MGEKVTTIMVMKVDLQCHRCYKKVKRVLSRYPQIQDQIYDEKQNAVTIKVVCCSPEQIKQKIIYRGGDSIRSIEIMKPPPPKPKTEVKPKPPDPKPAEKPVDAKPPDQPVPKPPEPAPFIYVPYYPQTYEAGAYSWPFYEGHGGGPSHHHGHGGPSPSWEEYHHAIGRPVYDSYGGGGYRPSPDHSRSDYYSSHEENPSGCIII
ncbi:protein PYRICULARIA ORYZAE RESISTANCE 21-like [Juglans microcarpa x Juglans regia]|uniref:protein PYRICULARIA ORYZAE RESISTANCE 21-like n=1 Tax=Juglans microcarpa x Juglans regia TaxID=2249226 RepID=UPI001B7F01B3|nr:protein PYRICULARIA ORYZAE RESISTANCE 21-like [Juglans microcarpa x Juglans regia]